MDCSICCEKFNKSNHFEINCNYCDLSACRVCVQQYLLGKIDEPSCMKCNNEWNREFLDTKLTKKFINTDLKHHRETILFEQEKCRLPAAQLWVAHENTRNELIRELQGIRIIIREKEWEVNQVNRMLDLNNFDGSRVRRQFTRKCPFGMCKGFLSSQWKCDICHNWTCPECNEVKGLERHGPHTCNPDDVETIKLLKKETKPCPSCGISIFKISGCSQMWCTECHTAFDWNTNRIIEGRIHNPHFFEARRRAGLRTRELGDVPCGGLPTKEEIAEAMGIHRHRYGWNMQWPIPLIDFVCEIDGKAAPQRIDYHKQRVMYIKGDMSEQALKKYIQSHERMFQRDREQYDVIMMVGVTLTDILRQIVTKDIDGSGASHSLREIIRYAQESLTIIARRYNLSTMYFYYNTGNREFIQNGPSGVHMGANFLDAYMPGGYSVPCERIQRHRKSIVSHTVMYNGTNPETIDRIQKNSLEYVTSAELLRFNMGRIHSITHRPGRILFHHYGREDNCVYSLI